jgi:hypothetical protein
MSCVRYFAHLGSCTAVIAVDDPAPEFLFVCRVEVSLEHQHSACVASDQMLLTLVELFNVNIDLLKKLNFENLPATP